MNALLRARCDRQIENEKAFRNMSSNAAESSIKVGSLLYTALDLPVNDDNVYESQKVLESKDGFFSNFQGALQALILIRMTVSKDPESYIDTIIASYNMLAEKTGVSGLFAVLTSVIIAEQSADQETESVIDQISDLYWSIVKHHPDRSNASELAYVALMLFAGKADASLEDEKEKIYKALKEKMQISDDAARATSLVLMTNSKSAEIKVDQFIAFYNNLNATGHATAENQYMSIYAAFADLTYLEELGIPESETITSIGEVDDYLKKKTGYGMFSINKDMRKVIAAALTLQHYTIEVPKEKHSDFTPEISLEMLLFIVLMSLVAII